ncbi:hypothetical protein VKT23_020797 [Stygiomarasmius scandens]|uniref:Glycosyl transferase CAP10 domain-containing protein n=1 Tax=Marasmiellus scandens TaxID=2682957 RepID=A0ABR1IUI7_9AGAR
MAQKRQRILHLHQKSFSGRSLVPIPFQFQLSPGGRRFGFSRLRVLVLCVVGVLVFYGVFWNGESKEERGVREEEVWLEETGDYSVENTVGIGGPSRVTLVHDAKTQSQSQVRNQNQDKQSSGDNATLPTGAGFTRTTWSTHSSTLTSHHFNPNGLLEVNPLSPTHPILTLIEQAKEEWAEKHARASTTLESAVVEYERRYNRPPPKGFDKWWAYVEKHEVLLPDEYDQIYNDLEHYWGVDPHVLISQTYERETRTAQGHVEDRYTIGKANWKTPIHMVNWSLPSAGEDEEREWALMEGGRWIVGMLEGRNAEWAEEKDEEEREDLTQYIPPFRATFSPHDSPSMLTDWSFRQKAVEHAREGRTFNPLSSPRSQSHHGWLSACPPDAPAWDLYPTYDFYKDDPWPQRGDPGSNSPSASSSHDTSKKTFIHNLSPSLSPCTHPHLLRQHTQFTKHFHGPLPESTSLVPLFSYSPSTLHHDIVSAIPLNWVSRSDMERSMRIDIIKDELGVDLSQPDTYAGREIEVAEILEATRDEWADGGDIPWEKKEDERLFWRGSNTGMWHSEQFLWRLGQRIGMMDWVQGRGFNKFMKVLGFGRGSDETRGRGGEDEEAIGTGALLHRLRYAQSTLDIAFSGSGPIACDEPTCSLLSRLYEFRKPVGIRGQSRYKYLLDVDGNAWSSRFKRLMSTNGVVLKATVYPEWWLSRIQPWLHFVPVQVDFSDLWDAFLFFRGDLNSGAGGHDDLAREIGLAGKEWSEKYWRWEDMVAYNFRLFLEYARVMSPNRNDEEMQYIHPVVSKFRNRSHNPSEPGEASSESDVGIDVEVGRQRLQVNLEGKDTDERDTFELQKS